MLRFGGRGMINRGSTEHMLDTELSLVWLSPPVRVWLSPPMTVWLSPPMRVWMTLDKLFHLL